MSKAKLEPVHISRISAGDTIEYNGKLSTVCAKDIHKGGFCGTTIFGDSYRSGTRLVQKVVGWIGESGNVVPYRY